MEITDRPDLGVDLKAPQRDDSGAEKWTYTLIREVTPGDVVLHWSTPPRSVVGWSISDGEWWEEPIVWGAHGTTARAAGVAPYPRPGLRRALTSYSDLAFPITKESIQEWRPEIAAVRAELELLYGEPLYFPFQLRSDEIRAAQGYLVKFPRALLTCWPLALREITVRETDGSSVEIKSSREHTIGADYRRANELVSTAARDPFAVDPNLVDRGTRGHAMAQNYLAEWVRASGATPLSPSGAPLYDLAWESDGRIFVAEVKSLTDTNEERQLRLGLGQVLRYRQMLASTFGAERVVGVLMIERMPRDGGWIDLCRSLDVQLVWPECVARLGEL